MVGFFCSYTNMIDCCKGLHANKYILYFMAEKAKYSE